MRARRFGPLTISKRSFEFAAFDGTSTVAQQAKSQPSSPRTTVSKTEKPIFLMSGYLLRSTRVAHERQTLGFSIDLGILVPDYTVNRAWRPDDHYEGGYIYRDKINLDLATEPEQGPLLRFGFDRRTPNRVTQPAVATGQIDGQYEFRVPIKSPSRPGIKGELLFKAQPWS